MKAYCAGPMTGLDSFNFPAFFQGERVLRKNGFEVGNPARWDLERMGYQHPVICDEDARIAGDWVGTQPFNLREAAEMDLMYLIHEADAIALLPGWSRSKGARAEKATAEWLGLEIIFFTEEMDLIYV